MTEGRPLPVIDGVYVSPKAARMLAASWAGIEDLYRRNALAVPPELLDVIDACRVVTARRISAVGSALDADAEAAAGSADGEITTATAAERLECSERQVRNLCGSGQLRARKVGAAWLVDAASLEDHRAGRAAAG